MIESIFVLIAAGMALSAVGALALAMHWGRKREEGLVPYVFYFSLLAAAVGAILSTRDFSIPPELAVASGRHPIASWLQRFSSIFLLLSCGERVLHWIANRSKARTLPKLLLVGFLLYFGTNIVIPAIFGRHRLITHEYLYVAVFVVAAVMFSMKEAERTFITLRNAILIYLLLGAALLVVKPSQVADMTYHGIIPGLHFRYASLAPHANSLGPLVVVFLICLWRMPFANQTLQRVIFGFALLNLLLAQSKTSWLCALMAAGCIAYYTYGPLIRARLIDHRRPILPVALVLGAMAGLAILVGILMFVDVGSSLGRMLASKEGADLTSFTGRDAIWRVAVQEWERNPVFGYGLTIWDPSFTKSIGMPFAVHAHGQFFQSVSSAGTVGLVGLIIYIGVLSYLVARTARVSGGMSLALFLILLLRGITEIPLNLTGFAIDTITHLLLIVVLAAYYSAGSQTAKVKTTNVIYQKRGFA